MWIEVTMPSGRRRIRLRRRPLTIGRAPDNVFVIRDENLSRHHAVIEPNGPGRWRIRDLGSRNGTFANGTAVTEHELRDGDRLRVGAVEIRVRGSIRPRPTAPAPATAAEIQLDPIALASDPAVDPLAGFDPLDAAFVPPEDRGRSGAGSPRRPGGDGFEADMQAIIDPTPGLGFSEDDLHLIDAAGDTMHAAEDRRRREDPRFAGIHALRLMLYACFRSRATDLHLEDRGEDAALMRLRVDGMMIPPIEVAGPVARRAIAIVRVLCRLDTARRKQVLDGHFSVRVRERRVDYRASFAPAMRGEKLVVRVLDGAAAPSRLADLHLAPWMEQTLRRTVTRDAGLVLASGPTGSGKTTSLYALMREIDCSLRNVITIEDPVEYAVPGVTQIPVDEDAGNGFATILRSVLRQDPDVLLVGEIRDRETAMTVMQASMTGHLVFSTVHARDTISSVFRLLDLGIEPYLLANALNVVLSQRLVRALCRHCRRAVAPTSTQIMRMGRADPVERIHQPMGCRRCLGTGYHGRRAVVELLDVGEEMRDLILGGPSIAGMRRIAGGRLFTSLEASAWQLVADGITSVEEVDRIARD
ncbi:MAG: ATPase, T2SS/T4P/T4SS family [Planctomycetota bacterium]